jgi:hypothetical protein
LSEIPNYARGVLAIKLVGICELRICRLPDTATKVLQSAMTWSDQPIAKTIIDKIAE